MCKLLHVSMYSVVMCRGLTSCSMKNAYAENTFSETEKMCVYHHYMTIVFSTCIGMCKCCVSVYVVCKCTVHVLCARIYAISCSME